MRIHATITLLALLGATHAGAASLPSVIDTNAATVGPITSSTPPQDEVLGAYPPVMKPVGEGFCRFTTHAFNTSSKRLDVVWKLSPASAAVEDCDSPWPEGTPATPEYVRIDRPDSPWATQDGITIGTTLTELEKLAGGPITFSGFGFDGAGMCCKETQGPFKSLKLRLDVTTPTRKLDKTAKNYLNDTLTGDKPIKSDSLSPRMRKKLGIKVTEIYYYFPQ